jgi:hypothetical protein
MRRVMILAVVLAVIAPTATTAGVAATDASDPYVAWHSPFDGQAPTDTLTVDDGTVRLNATVRDTESGIDRVVIERVYSDDDTFSRNVQRVDDLHNQTIHAGTFSESAVVVRVFNNAGLVDRTEFSVTVNDDEAPTADLQAVRDDDGRIDIQGTVRDATQPETAEVIMPDRNNPVIRFSTQEDVGDGKIDLTRTTGELNVEVADPRPEHTTVDVRVRDRAGNERDIGVPLPDPAADETATPTSTVTATSNATPEPTVTPVPTAATPAATPEPTAAPSTDTQTPVPTTTPSGGAGPVTVIFRFLIIGIGLFAIGGWLSLQ